MPPEERGVGGRASVVAATAVSLVLIGATLSPLLRDPNDDGFPLSTYPMFATRRPTELTMSYALGVTRSGERRYLRPYLIGSGEVLQAYTILSRAVSGGAGPSQALCRTIAERVRMAGDDDILTVRIVTGTHDALDVLVRDQLGREQERTRCQVRR